MLEYTCHRRKIQASETRQASFVSSAKGLPLVRASCSQVRRLTYCLESRERQKDLRVVLESGGEKTRGKEV